MKNLLFIIMFVPLVSLGQTQPIKVEVEQKQSFSQSFNESLKAGAAARTARAASESAAAARANAMSESFLEIKTPLTVDLYKYSHVALVDVTYAYPNGNKVIDKTTYERFKQLLINSPLTIINPREYNKKKFKKNMRFLRDIKNPSWLYLYYSTSIQGVDEMRSLVIRNSKNQIIYNVKSRNITKDELVQVVKDRTGVAVSEKHLEGMLQGCDENDDGQVDYEEFCTLMTKSFMRKRVMGRSTAVRTFQSNKV